MTRSRSLKIVVCLIVLSMFIAVCEVLTHLMIPSTLGEEPKKIEVELAAIPKPLQTQTATEDGVVASNKIAIYDIFLHDTIKYNATLVTVFMWVAFAIMVAFVPPSKLRTRQKKIVMLTMEMSHCNNNNINNSKFNHRMKMKRNLSETLHTTRGLLFFHQL